MTMFMVLYHDIVIARVNLVYFMNADWAPGGRQPSDQTNRFGLWVCKDWLLPSADTIAIYYYYSARKLILILPSHGGWKAEST